MQPDELKNKITYLNLNVKLTWDLGDRERVIKSQTARLSGTALQQGIRCSERSHCKKDYLEEWVMSRIFTV